MTLAGLARRLRLALTVFFVFALPLVMSPFNQQYPKLIFVLTFGPLLFLLWLVEMLHDREAHFDLPGRFWLGLLLVEVALISLVNSRNIRVGLESLGLLLCFLFLYLLLVNTVRDEKSVLLLLASIFAAAVLASAYGLSQYYGYDPLIRARVRPGIGSIISTMGNKNYLGGFLAYLFMPYGLLLLRAPRRWQKLSILAGMAAIWYAIMAIGSRAVWLGLAIGAIFLLAGALWLKLLRLRLIKQNLGWIIGLIALMAVIAAIFLFPHPLNLSGTILGRVAEGVEALTEPYVRYYDWWVTWEMIKAHPFIGIGLGDFKLEFLDYKAKFLETPRGEQYKDLYIPQALQAHNDYLQMWAELGTLGLLVIAGLIFTVFASSWKRAKQFSLGRGVGKAQRADQSPDEGKALAILLMLAGVLTFMGDAFFSFPLHLPASALCLVVLLAILDSGYLGADARKVRLPSHPKWALVLLSLALALVMVTFAVRDFIADLYSTRGEALYRAGAWAEAKGPLERSLRWDFEPKEALFYLGVIYAREGELRKAREALERALGSYTRVTAVFNLGIVSLAQGDLEGALHYLDLAARIDPTNLEYLYHKGRALMLAGRLEEGVRVLEKVINKDPSYHRAYMRLGEYYQQLGLADKALEYYQGAMVAIKRKLEGLAERVKQPALPRSEQERIREELTELKGDKETIEAALQALQEGGQAPPAK